MRLLFFIFLVSCTDGIPVSDDFTNVQPDLNPFENIEKLNERPKCELPAVEQLASLHDGSIANTQPASQDGFDSMDAMFQEVALPMPDVRACEPTPFSQTLTNGLAHRVSGASGASYRHLNTLTFVPNRHASAKSRAEGDLYFHGSKGEPLYLVLRKVDFRKFLYQDIILHDCVAFPERCDTEKTPGPGNTWRGGEPVLASVANQPFDSQVFQCIRNVHGYFAEFNRITKKIPESAAPGEKPKRLFHLTNNCREPGNYELALVDDEAGKQWGNHISLDIGFYASILRELEVDYKELGTGVRVVGTDRNQEGKYQYAIVEKKEFPASCHIANLAPYIGKAQRLLTPQPIAIEQAKDGIPWEAYASETQAKSGRKSDEVIVYVAVDGSQEVPAGFRSIGFHFETGPDGVTERITDSADEGSWEALSRIAKTGKKVNAPHTFATFGDVASYPFQISSFEVDGRYLGRLKEKRLSTAASRMYGFDYRFLQGLTHAEARVAIEQDGKTDGEVPRLEFRLLNEGCAVDGASCINLVLGNVRLKPGEQTQYVLGIGTQPLRDMYVNNVYQTEQQYALTYDEKGHITDLATRHGLGMIYVRRGKGKESKQFIVDLVSYERALPLWRATINLSML